jgi:SfnB family sulfur acquisition oxidoreductase
MAHVIRSDEEAIEVAGRLAQEFSKEAARRDRERLLPHRELDLISSSGLLGITVPKEYGGADVSCVTLAEVFRLLSAGDSSLGQIPQNHFFCVEALTLEGSPEQKKFFFTELLEGKRFGNALSERGGKHVFDLATNITRLPGGGGYLVNGKKFYSTGALFADWIPVMALDEHSRAVIAFVPRAAEGLEVIDDWSGMGQRTTASGTTVLHNVHVPENYIVQHYRTYLRPQYFGAHGQLMHVAIDVGIAEAALADTREFVRTRSRYYFDTDLKQAANDPFVVRRFGELKIYVNAARALLASAAEAVDRAKAKTDEATTAASSIAVAEAKQLAEWTVLKVTNDLFELSGTSATLAEFDLDRHWRNARTHTLHDPSRWKTYAVGNYYLNDIRPNNHILI